MYSTEKAHNSEDRKIELERMEDFMRFRFVLLTGLLLVASSAFAGRAEIYAFRTDGVAAAGFATRMCRVADPSQCYYTVLTDSYGHATVTVGIGYEGDYYLYLYRNYGVNYGGEWGSQTEPIGKFPVPYVMTSIGVQVSPRPLPPKLVTPCNYCGIPSANFYLKWTNGLDASRRNPSWPVTYDIWASETPVGWPTQPEKLTIANAPCNADAQGNCQWWIDALIPESGRKYTWRIVVKLQVGPGVVYTTSGPSWNLVQY
jgi:hypothetical protein